MRVSAVRSRWFLAVLGMVALPGWVSADTIYLKNGRKITGTNVVQENGQIRYETPEGQLSLPASIVDHVVKEAGSPGLNAGTPSDRAANLKISAPAEINPSEGNATAAQAVRDGSINTGLLAKLETEAGANPTPAAIDRVVTAEIAAAQFEISVGDFEKAATHYNVGLRFAPDDTGLLIQSAYLHLRRSEYSAAQDLLERARRNDPDSPDVARLSGWAYYGLNRISDAVAEWKRAQELKPDPATQQALEKAERDAVEEAGYREGETSHFRLLYNGSAAPELAAEVLKTLETQFGEIAAALNYVPPEPIGVVLYTNQKFADITRAPGWTGALNDGRIRVPVEGLSSMTKDLERVLKHELTHSFVGQRSQGHCPVWLQEGLAQYMEGKRSRQNAATLSTAYQNHMDLSLESYETSWLNLPQETALSAYAWSLATVEAMLTEGTMDDMGQILDRLAAGSTTEDAIHAVLRDTYPELAKYTADYLRKAYL